MSALDTLTPEQIQELKQLWGQTVRSLTRFKPVPCEPETLGGDELVKDRFGRYVSFDTVRDLGQRMLDNVVVKSNTAQILKRIGGAS